MNDWKDIRGFEGYYQVSTEGFIRSCDRDVKHSKGGLARKRGRVISQHIGNSGYAFCMLNKEGKVHHIQVHRAVAIAFIPNPLGKEQVNHRNAIKTDNRVDNLEWCTPSENMQHALSLNLIDTKKTAHYGKSNHSARSVECYDPNTGRTIKSFELMKDACEYYGLTHSAICSCCKGYKKSAKGLFFRYKV